MTVRDTSMIALEDIRKTLCPSRQAVFEVILELGPTHDNRILEYLNQSEAFKTRGQRRQWTINQVTGRRNDLVGIGIVVDLGAHRGLWCGLKKTYHLWAVRGDHREPTGWLAVPKKDLPQQKRPLAERRAKG